MHNCQRSVEELPGHAAVPNVLAEALKLVHDQVNLPDDIVIDEVNDIERATVSHNGIWC